MNQAFIDPNGSNKEEIKKLMREMSEIVLEYTTQAAEHQPLPLIEKIDFSEFSREGTSTDQLLQEIKDILSKSMNPLTPNYIGHMDSIPTVISSLSEFVVSSINNNMLSIEMSPVFSQMEVQVLEKLAQMFGFDKESGGVMTSGGSLANLQALAVARNHQLNVKEEGLTSLNEKPVLFVSEASHTSIHKAAMLLGLGTDSVLSVACNKNAQMNISDLEEKIREAKKNGMSPFAIVATAGTTVTGSIDPINPIAEIADKHQLWLHVDAAYGGALIFSEKHREKIRGIERADSITFNPQKWMFVAKTCAMVLFKNRSLLESEFQILAPYMKETDFTNLGEISVQGTRHAEILKLYMSIQHIGLKGYEELINRTYALKEGFQEQVQQRSYLELAVEGDTNICCFRICSGERDKLNTELQQVLLEKGFFLSLPIYRGERWLRAVLLNPYFTKRLIGQLFQEIDRYYARISEF